MNDHDKALLELIKINKDKIGKLYHPKKVLIAELKLKDNKGIFEQIQYDVVNLQEKLAMTEDILYKFMSLMQSDIEDRDKTPEVK
jgi:hypothetical protein